MVAAVEAVDALDEQGRPVGVITREEAHRTGALHRCVHVFALDPQGKLWLQKRALDRRLWPGLWTSSASGHVEAGEAEDAAARRELEEELGVKGEPRRVGEFRYRDAEENELAGLWVLETAARPVPGPEVLAVMDVGKEELAALMARLPSSFAPSFVAALRAYGWA